jgi:hypothetical protein
MAVWSPENVKQTIRKALNYLGFAWFNRSFSSSVGDLGRIVIQETMLPACWTGAGRSFPDQYCKSKLYSQPNRYYQFLCSPPPPNCFPIHSSIPSLKHFPFFPTRPVCSPHRNLLTLYNRIVCVSKFPIMSKYTSYTSFLQFTFLFVIGAAQSV